MFNIRDNSEITCKFTGPRNLMLSVLIIYLIYWAVEQKACSPNCRFKQGDLTHQRAAVKLFQRLPTPRKPAEVCVLSIILYCSPAIFSGLLKHSMSFMKLSSNACGLGSCYRILKFICEHYIKAASGYALGIREDDQHFLHADLLKTRSHNASRSSVKLLPSKTAACRNAVPTKFCD